MDSVHPFIQTGICFRAQICCMLRLNCLKAARRIADHLLKQTREIIGIAKSNVPLSAGTESAVVCSSSSAHRMRTQLRYSMRLSNSEGAQRISPVLPGTGYKNGLIPWQRYEAVFILGLYSGISPKNQQPNSRGNSGGRCGWRYSCCGCRY